MVNYLVNHEKLLVSRLAPPVLLGLEPHGEARRRDYDPDEWAVIAKGGGPSQARVHEGSGAHQAQ